MPKFYSEKVKNSLDYLPFILCNYIIDYYGTVLFASTAK